MTDTPSEQARRAAEPLFMSIYGGTQYVPGDDVHESIKRKRREFYEAFQSAIDAARADDKKVIEELNQRYDRLVDDHDALDAEADTLKMQCDSLTEQLAQCRAALNAAKEEG